MARYGVQSRCIKAGFIADAEDGIEEAIQPVLDGGSANGGCFTGSNPRVFIAELPD